MSHAISVFGLGYVGTVAAACLAHKGNRVIGVDVNAAKVEVIERGQSPILEPGLTELISEVRRSNRLRATVDAARAVSQTDISFICVGTPGLRDGKFDLSHVESVCSEIGQALRKKDSFHLIVLRSTVLPETTESVVIPRLQAASGRMAGSDFGVCVNPEFMREGTAVNDFLEPVITVIAAARPEHSSLLRELYAWAPGKVFETSIRSAEMLKHVCNAWHAAKVSFANEVGTLAKELGADAETVMQMFTADTRLNVSASYLKPGLSFGGSCLPKDLRAITSSARSRDLRLPLIESILRSNEAHLDRAVEMALNTGKRRVGVLGLSFKPATDDLRESPQVQLVKRLLAEGRDIRIWDENVLLGKLIGSNRQYIEEIIPHIGSLLLSSLEEVVRHAEVVILGSRNIDRDALGSLLRPEHYVIDLVNVERARRPDRLTAYEGICW